jgi:hypothetical protein
MSTEERDAYGEVPSRIGRHQSETATVRFTVFEAPATVGVSPE